MIYLRVVSDWLLTNRSSYIHIFAASSVLIISRADQKNPPACTHSGSTKAPLLLPTQIADLFLFQDSHTLHKIYIATAGYYYCYIYTASMAAARGRPSYEYDVVVFGATSFVGSLVAEYFLTNYGASPSAFKWALAAR